MSDANGNALAASTYLFRRAADNLLDVRQQPLPLHAIALSYGLVNWLTNGLFLGSRHIYLSAQVDDLLTLLTSIDPDRLNFLHLRKRPLIE